MRAGFWSRSKLPFVMCCISAVGLTDGGGVCGVGGRRDCLTCISEMFCIRSPEQQIFICREIGHIR